MKEQISRGSCALQTIVSTQKKHTVNNLPLKSRIRVSASKCFKQVILFYRIVILFIGPISPTRSHYKVEGIGESKCCIILVGMEYCAVNS